MADARSSAAACTACGGSIPLQLHGPLTCPYCGAVDAVDARSRALLTAVRERIGRREKQKQQFLAQGNLFTSGFYERVSRQFLLLCVLWVFAGLIILGTASGLLKNGESLSDVVFGRLPITTDDQRLAWAAVYAGVLFAVFTFGLPTLGLLNVTMTIGDARPLPPAREGTAPRCRCCLAELPAEGTVRRCAYCGADNLVLDDRYRAEQTSLDRVVQDALMRGERSLRKQLEFCESLVSWALATVVFSVVAMPIVGGLVYAAVTPAPAAFLYPGLLGGAALGVYLRVRRRVQQLESAPQPDLQSALG